MKSMRSSASSRMSWLIYPCLAGAVLAALRVGRYPIGSADILALLGGGEISEQTARILINRAARVFGAVAVGAGLSAAGAVYQTVFRNPMISPSILGVSSGASFGAALGILGSADAAGIRGLAFAFGLASVAATYGIALRAGVRGGSLALVLAGTLTGTVFSALVSLLKVIADPQSKLPAITYWLMGSLSGMDASDTLFVAVSCAAGLVPLFLLRYRITALSFGDEETRALGMNPGRLRLAVVVAATLVTSAAVSVSGVIGWVGLVVPHIARALVGPHIKKLLPASVLIGGLYLLGIDTFCRSVAAIEFPIGIVTSLLGAPFFAFFLIRARRNFS